MPLTYDVLFKRPSPSTEEIIYTYFQWLKHVARKVLLEAQNDIWLNQILAED